ncbi:MAG: acetate/propionate family kinase [Candidatus Pacebacteria bacterium]|nr:acetate/propionate family kinase [Candidatus Paceibacterota bacterium]MBP9842687.1 acetate/propionate family kinase [Candidatus Paceibacterota bacterium]
MGITLVVNPGSSSKKYALYKEGQAVLEYSYEGGEAGFEVCTQKRGQQQTCESIMPFAFQTSFAHVAKVIEEYCQAESCKIDVISVRVVAPGTAFQKHALIDETYLAMLRSREVSAPLHIPAIIKEIQACREYFPNTPLVAASDSAFHATLPLTAREFSLRRADAATLDIHRFGYHGLSVASIVNRIHAVIGQDPARLVVCHVGSGVSVSAVKNGTSVETTMGYSPVSGIPMGTRASDLDAGAFLEIMRQKNMRPSEASVYLNTGGGLAGLAEDGDIRRLLDRRSKGDMSATLALDLFVYRIQKEIAASTVALQGIDALVLTGTAAFRSSELRSLISHNLSYLGIDIDSNRNDVLAGREGVVSVQNAKVKVIVMRTDEMREMARIAESLIK